MPAKSAKQYRFMSMIAHGKKPNDVVGPSQKVAKEFVGKTPPSKRSQFMKNMAKKKK